MSRQTIRDKLFLMPAKLAPHEETVVVQFKIPATLKRKAAKLAKESGDGDVSHWIRRQIHNAWKAAEAQEER